MSRSVTVVGGGFAALEVALALKKSDPGIPVTVLSREKVTVYRPLLIRQPAGEPPPPVIPFARLLDAAGVELQDALVTAADLDACRLTLDTGAHLEYDQLIVATGASADRDRVPGARGRAIFPCDLDGAEQLSEATAGGGRRLAIVFGWERPGPGLEYAAWIAARRPDVPLMVIDGDGVLESRFGPRATAWLEALFKRRGAQLMAGRRIERVTDEGVELDGATIASEVVALASPLRGNTGWLSGSLLNDRGLLRVDANLAAAENVFGIGDVVAPLDGHPLAPALMSIRRLAPRLARSIAEVRGGGKPKRLLRPGRPPAMLPDLCGTALLVRDRRMLTSGRLPPLDAGQARAALSASEGGSP